VLRAVGLRLDVDGGDLRVQAERVAQVAQEVRAAAEGGPGLDDQPRAQLVQQLLVEPQVQRALPDRHAAVAGVLPGALVRVVVEPVELLDDHVLHGGRRGRGLEVAVPQPAERLHDGGLAAGRQRRVVPARHGREGLDHARGERRRHRLSGGLPLGQRRGAGARPGRRAARRRRGAAGSSTEASAEAGRERGWERSAPRQSATRVRAAWACRQRPGPYAGGTAREPADPPRGAPPTRPQTDCPTSSDQELE
jgi:hypothetical protein